MVDVGFLGQTAPNFCVLSFSIAFALLSSSFYYKFQYGIRATFFFCDFKLGVWKVPTHSFSQNSGASKSCYGTKTTPTSSTSLDLHCTDKVKLFRPHTDRDNIRVKYVQ